MLIWTIIKFELQSQQKYLEGGKAEQEDHDDYDNDESYEWQ